MSRVNKMLAIVLIVMFVGSVLSGCSNSAPKCSDSETIELVEQITLQKIAETYGQDTANGMEISVDAIRTTESNDKTGAQQCAAQLTFKGPIGEKSFDITYKSEKTDKGDEFYVTVYGL